MTRDEFAAFIQAIAINQLAARLEPLTPKSVELQINWNCASYEASVMHDSYDRRDWIRTVLEGIKPFSFEEFLNDAESNELESEGYYEEVLAHMRGE